MEESNEWLEVFKDGVLLRIYVQPGASKSEFCGLFGDPSRLKLRIKAPPVEGKANKAIIEFLANYFSLKKVQIEQIRGEQSRNKDFYISLEYCLVQKLLDRKHLK